MNLTAMNKPKVTIRDLAKALGVSTTLVSFAMSDSLTESH